MKLPDDYDIERTIEVIRDAPGGHLVDEVYLPGETSRITDPVPEIWKDLLNMTAAEAIDLLWKDCVKILPGFIDLLKDRLLTIFIGRGIKGPVLIYFLEGLIHDSGFDLDSALIGGPPLTENELNILCQDFKDIPADLSCFWRVHGFFTTSHHSYITDFSKTDFQGGWYDRPPVMKKKDAKGAVVECLPFSNMWNEYPWCYTRNEGDVKWSEKIHDVCRFADMDDIIDSLWDLTLDEFMLDY